MPLLRTCSSALATALTPGSGVKLFRTDLFTFTILSGHVYRWTNYPQVLTVGGNLYSPVVPAIQKAPYRLTPNMEIPTLELTVGDKSQVVLGGSSGFGGVGASFSLRTALVNGLFDGASMTYNRLFLGADLNPATYGSVYLFAGDVGPIKLQGASVVIKCRGLSSRLSVQAPRNVFQPGCIHTFCDAGCTLNPASFTDTLTVQASPTTTTTVIALLGSSLLYPGGTLTMTSGPTNGEVRSIIAATPTTVTIANPLTIAPAVGTTCTVLHNCDKTLNMCTNEYANTVNFRGFPYVPPPDTTAP